jgi:hypothetical protein
MVVVHPERTAWEYRTMGVNKADVTKSPDRHWPEMQKLGSEGWELVAVCPLDKRIDFVFKRQAPLFDIQTGVPRAGDDEDGHA